MKLQPRSNLQQIPDGPEGIYITLRAMRNFVRKNKKNPVFRELSISLTNNLGQKDWSGEIKAIHHFVKNNIRYVRDVTDVETVCGPLYTLDKGAGDCDDKSVLAATLLESIGHPTRFVAIGFSHNVYNHVYIETKIGNQWISVETTEPVEIGWKPKGVVSRMEIYN